MIISPGAPKAAALAADEFAKYWKLVTGRDFAEETNAVAHFGIDPAFYEECMKPLVARLNPYRSKVKPDMTDEEVMDVYEHAAKEWMNIDFIVSRLRERYVERKLIEDAGF